MGSVRSILSSKQFWILVLIGLLILITPFVIVFILLMLPFPYNTIATLGIFVMWGIAAGYKDWMLAKRKEEESRKKEHQS